MIFSRAWQWVWSLRRSNAVEANSTAPTFHGLGLHLSGRRAVTLGFHPLDAVSTCVIVEPTLFSDGTCGPRWAS
jgi:hypothetical protein